MESKEIYLNRIKINNVRNITGFEIPLSKSERKHLIFTGRNGSGKTTVLLEIKKYLDIVSVGKYQTYAQLEEALSSATKELNALQNSVTENEQRLGDAYRRVESIKNGLEHYGGVKLDFSGEHRVANEVKLGKFLIAFFDAKRMTNLNIPNGIHKVNLKTSYSSSEKSNTAFIQYIVNMKAERSFARDEGEDDEAKKIDLWFNSFEEKLKAIFEDNSLKLIFDRKNYNFKIKTEGRELFGLTELSDGHSAILSIITELILRMESLDSGNYNLPGIVLIDEIETHLHVDLHKMILPFLSSFFPNIQFIVTTHSPFVLQSISNSVVCDLQNNIIVEDLSGYSYDALIESYFGSDKYSNSIKNKIERYEVLSSKNKINDEEREEYLFLKQYLKNIPKYYAPEFEVKLQEIELKKLSKGLD